MSNYEIRKDPTYYMKWRLYRDGEFITRSTHKCVIVWLKQLYEGDLSVAPLWYRQELKNAKRDMSAKDALRSAILKAQLLGLKPEHVLADPETGEPLP